MKYKALSATFVSALFCGFLLWAPSCSTPPLTEIIVHVTSAFPADQLDTIRLVINRGEQSRAVTVNLEDQALPFTQGVVHRGGSFDVSISVEAVYQERVVVTQLAPIGRFVEGQTVHVSVDLSPSCVSVTCEAGTACVAGMCVNTSTDAGIADAGPPDVGLFDVTLDAYDAGPGLCPTKRVDIEGEYVCAAGCDTCDLRCKMPSCRVVCRPGATCSVEQESNESQTEVWCEDSTCHLSTKNKRSGNLSARCLRSTCDLDCAGDGSCQVTCDDSTCEADCGDNPNCRLVGDECSTCGGGNSVCGDAACP